MIEVLDSETRRSDTIDETVRAYTGADAFGVNAIEPVNLCKRWTGAAA
jgi:hypothetical protein